MVSHLFPVALARGRHLFPFRTEQLSPSAPMVLGSQGPGRVGRRRFFLDTRAAERRPVVVLRCSRDAPAEAKERVSQPARRRRPRRSSSAGCEPPPTGTRPDPPDHLPLASTRGRQCRPTQWDTRLAAAVDRVRGLFALRRRFVASLLSRCVRRPHSCRRGARAADGAKADLRARPRLARPALGRQAAQRRSVRMLRMTVPVLADLPVDVVAVLEQQERAGQAKRTERALRKR